MAQPGSGRNPVRVRLENTAMRRSGRQPRGGSAFTADSLPPHVANGLRAFVRSCPSHVAAMVDASSSPGVAPDPDALTDKLAGVMAVNSLSAESMLARFFTGVTMADHLVAAYGKSGKGNPATLAARLVAQWKPSRSGDASGARGAKKRKNEDDQSGEEAATEARSVGGEGGAKEVNGALENHCCVEDEVWKKDDDADEREETRALPPPPKKRFHHDRS